MRLPEPAATRAVPAASKDRTAGHTQALPVEAVVPTASGKVEAVAPVKPPVSSATQTKPARPWVDYAFVREQVTMEQVLSHLGVFAGLRGRGPATAWLLSGA